MLLFPQYITGTPWLFVRFSNYMKKNKEIVNTCRRNPNAVVWVIIWVLWGKKRLLDLQKEKSLLRCCANSAMCQSINLSLIQIQTLTDKDYFYNGCGLKQTVNTLFQFISSSAAEPMVRLDLWRLSSAESLSKQSIASTKSSYQWHSDSRAGQTSQGIWIQCNIPQLYWVTEVYLRTFGFKESSPLAFTAPLPDSLSHSNIWQCHSTLSFFMQCKAFE